MESPAASPDVSSEEPVTEDGRANVSTDKTYYLPNETVLISGDGFGNTETIQVVIYDSHGNEVFSSTATTDQQGIFNTDFVVPLNGMDEEYTLVATSTESGRTASTTFIDPDPTIEFITSPYILDPSTGGNVGDKDGEPPTSSSADPSVAIIGVKISTTSVLSNVRVTITDNNLDSVDDFTLNPAGATQEFATVGPGSFYVYWPIYKNQTLAMQNDQERYTVSVIYDGGSAIPVSQDVTLVGTASISQNDLGWRETYQSNAIGAPGDSFSIFTAYDQNSANGLDKLAAQIYYNYQYGLGYVDETLRLTEVSIYYYNNQTYTAGSLAAAGGVPAGYTNSFVQDPYLPTNQIPTSLDNRDYWVMKYTFSVVNPGETVIAPYVQTIKTGANWKVDSGYGGFNAGLCSISGYKFEDLNGDGVWQKDGTNPEQAISGVTINLSGTSSASTTTNASGFYQFTNLKYGSYTVSEVIPAGYTPTTPASATVTLKPGENRQIDFGNREIPTPTTLLSDDKITFGESVTDTATVTGLTGGPTPTGTVTFQVLVPGGAWADYDADVALTSGQATSKHIHRQPRAPTISAPYTAAMPITRRRKAARLRSP